MLKLLLFCVFILLQKNIKLCIMFAENKRKKELIQMLQEMGYDSDPVKAWKQAQEKVES